MSMQIRLSNRYLWALLAFPTRTTEAITTQINDPGADIDQLLADVEARRVNETFPLKLMLIDRASIETRGFAG